MICKISNRIAIILFLILGSETANATYFSGAQKIVKQLQLKIANKYRVDKVYHPAFYFIPMASQTRGQRFPYDHTFAVFVKVYPTGQQEWHTISWLPADFAKTRRFCVFKNYMGAVSNAVTGAGCQPVPGKSFSVVESLAWALEDNHRIAIWGPTRISSRLYELLKKQKDFLNSGSIKYLADDRISRSQGIAINCIHAVADLPGHRATTLSYFNIGTWGIKGTKHVIREFIKRGPSWLMESPFVDNYWVITPETLNFWN